jgi:tetratricopeptide (TPR) repeat protein
MSTEHMPSQADNVASPSRFGSLWMPAALLGALAVRVVGWLTLRSATFTAVPTYNDGIHQARALAILHGGFPESTLPWGSPLYPYVAAFIWSILGESAAALFSVQLLLGLATTALVAWALAPLLSPRARWIAAFLYGIQPLGVFFEMRLQPVVWGIALALPVIRLLFWGRTSWWSVLVGGALAGIGFLLQPLPFFALLVAAVWAQCRRESAGAGPSARRASWPSAVLIAAAFLVPVGVQCAHHAGVRGGGPVWNWSGAVDFERTQVPETCGTARSTRAPAWFTPGMAQAEANEVAARTLDEWGYAKHFTAQGVRLLAERPLEFIRSLLCRAVYLVNGREVPDPVSPRWVLGRASGALAWGTFVFPVFLLLVMAGLWRLRTDRALAAMLPPILGLVGANLLGLQSCAVRWYLVLAALPAAAVAVEGFRSIVADARTDRRGRILVPAMAVLAVLSALDLPGVTRRHDNPGEDLRAEAGLLVKKQDRRGATGLLQLATHRDPGNAMAHADLAALLVMEELPRAAADEYHAALRIDPLCPAALYGLAEVQRTQGEYAAAESTSLRLLGAHPNNALYLNQLATISMMRGRYDVAAGALKRALEIYPDYQVAQINQMALERAQRETATLAFPEEMTPPEDSELWRLGFEARVAMNTNNSARADSLTRLAVERNPRQPLALYMRGSWLLQAGRAPEASELLTQVAHMAPGRVLTTQMAAQALMAAGRNQEARELVEWSLGQATDGRNRMGLERMLEQMGTR